MSKWTDKYVIGLTGNIGTGKSVVRRMLEHLGAYGIDADALAHRAMAKGAPGYAPLLQTFGRWVLNRDGEIDRSKLGRVVFSDPEALRQLEGIIHPLVEQAVDILVRRSSQPVVVIEAIKLLEAGLDGWCDSIWVSYAPPEAQLARLVTRRHMTEAEAKQRIAAQSPQEEKMAVAQVIIRNDSTFTETWKQVAASWRKHVGLRMEEPATLVTEVKRPTGEISVLRGKPRHSDQIAELINRVRKPGQVLLTSEDIMETFGEKAYFLLQVGTELVGLIGWQVENLVTRVLNLVIDARLPVEEALPVLIDHVEKASHELQCEVSLVVLPAEQAYLDREWRKLGYELRSPQALGVQAWQEAAQEALRPGEMIYFKQLRTDRVLRPI